MPLDFVSLLTLFRLACQRKSILMEMGQNAHHAFEPSMRRSSHAFPHNFLRHSTEDPKEIKLFGWTGYGKFKLALQTQLFGHTQRIPSTFIDEELFSICRSTAFQANYCIHCKISLLKRASTVWTHKSMCWDILLLPDMIAHLHTLVTSHHSNAYHDPMDAGFMGKHIVHVYLYMAHGLKRASMPL